MKFLSKRYKWTSIKVTKLRKLYNKHSNIELEKVFNASKRSIRDAAEHYGISIPRSIPRYKYNHLTHSQCSYIAAIIDGEGNIAISKDKNSNSYTLLINISNTNKLLLTKL
jgi:hypothetical protein